MNAFQSSGRAAWLLIAAFSLLLLPSVSAAEANARDWRLSDLQKVIKASGQNLPGIITSVAIIDDDSLVVFVVSTRAPLSGSAAEATLTFTEKDGWKVTKVSFVDP